MQGKWAFIPEDCWIARWKAIDGLKYSMLTYYTCYSVFRRIPPRESSNAPSSIPRPSEELPHNPKRLKSHLGALKSLTEHVPCLQWEGFPSNRVDIQEDLFPMSLVFFSSAGGSWAMLATKGAAETYQQFAPTPAHDLVAPKQSTNLGEKLPSRICRILLQQTCWDPRTRDSLYLWPLARCHLVVVPTIVGVLSQMMTWYSDHQRPEQNEWAWEREKKWHASLCYSADLWTGTPLY